MGLILFQIRLLFQMGPNTIKLLALKRYIFPSHLPANVELESGMLLNANWFIIVVFILVSIFLV